MRTRGHRLAAAAFGAALFLGLAPSAQASPSQAGEAPSCGQVWGSLPESRPAATAGDVVTDVRAGRHTCFDRVVVDLRGPADQEPFFDVRYVPAATQQGSGAAVTLRGGAVLRVIVGAPAYDDYRPTYLPSPTGEAVDVTGFATVRQVAWTGSFEGQSSLALGTRARLPFRTFVLLGEPGSDRAVRLVIDVGHRW